MRASRVIAVIPARFASTRLPGKPLLPILGGEPMIVHTIRAALAAQTVAQVVVATDHDGIADAAERAGARAVLTDSAIPTGTDRVAAALREMGAETEVVVNVQGDEPLIQPSSIDLVANLLLDQPMADMATLSAPLLPDALLDPHKVKVVCNDTMTGAYGRYARALFFSRAPIGVDRDALLRLLQSDETEEHSTRESSGAGEEPQMPHNVAAHACRLHVGLYAFRSASLHRFVSLPPSPLERLERLEQMRALEDGMHILVGEIDAHARGVDTWEDVRVLEEEWARQTGASA